jgi:nanoRNase/pAp phosphatase (c-di-AMP/oligoRNAs hydrolase)
MLDYAVNTIKQNYMGFTPQEQLKEQIAKSNNILICVGRNSDGDSLGAALALYSFLKKIDKKVDIISPHMILEKYSFMPYADMITHKIQGARDYIFSLDIDKNDLHQLRYEVEEQKLKIFITAKSGEIEKDDLSLESSRFNYDLIFIIGATDLENLGNIYDENPELFYEIPVVNIDHKPSNEHFGKINLVELSASSTAEVMFNLLTGIDESRIDEESATNLLTGIISATESFQNKKTTPKVFLAAASLVSKGANKQDIVRYLYKTRSISMLKLMGKAMINLKYNSQYKLAWSVIESGEFMEEGTSAENMGMVARELANNSPEFELMMIIYPATDGINGVINFSERNDLNELVKALNGKIEEGQINFKLSGSDTETAEKEALNKIRDFFNHNKE